jgi:glycosyltransferase involved in cell wall biosynthesis
MDLTVAYITSRVDPKIEWFFDSLDRQTRPGPERVVVVDFHKDDRPLDVRGAIHVAPKPNVWQGKHRLTKEDWFAAANARNTALCLAPDGFLAYVDDVSVLMPGWLDAVRRAMAGNYIVLGAYKKVQRLEVDLGIVRSYQDYSTDSRLGHSPDGRMLGCGGSWLFGCSLAGPVEWFLTVNGWPEMSDGLSFEDVLMGFALQNNGFPMQYDPKMLTFESEEAHHNGKVFRRTDKGVSPNDKSHAALNIAKISKDFPNYFGEGGIRRVREAVLRGEPFPIQQIPENDWFDGQFIRDMV